MKLINMLAFLFILLLPGCTAERMASHFNELASDQDSRPDDVVRSLGIKPGMAIADIGSGGGFFAIRFAHETGPGGVVYAVDIDAGLLKIVDERAAKEGLKNVRIVQAVYDDSNLPEKSVDLIFARNVFHDIRDQLPYFKKLMKALKPGGRVAIIDYRGSLSQRISGHYMPVERIIETMLKAGYSLEKRHEFLTNQTFTVYVVGDDAK